MVRLFLALVLFSVNAWANGVLFGPTNVVSVTATSTLAVPTNSLRVYLILVNTGSNTIYVKPNTVQATTEGIPIPAGGNYEPFQAPSSSFYVDTASSTSTLTWIEGQ